MSNKENFTSQGQTGVNRGKTPKGVICHRCQWGAAPGQLTRCRSPHRLRALRELTGGLMPNCSPEVAAWGIISIAAAEGHCPEFLSSKPRKALQGRKY